MGSRKERLTEIREWYATHDSHPSGTSLARWVTNQRQRHKKGLLSPEQITELEAVPGWVWRLHPTWESRLTEIREWYATHDSHPSGTSLGRWTAAQRSNYKHGRLSSERAAALDAVPGWVWRFNRKHAWWERCAEAAEWYSSNSHLPARSTKFGKWVDVQRTNRSSLDADQIAALEAIPGWSWPKPTPSWEQSRKAWLKRYMADGKVRAPSPEQAWSAKQKVAYKEGTIPSDRVAALEATPGWVWSGRHPRPDQTPTQR